MASGGAAKTTTFEALAPVLHELGYHPVPIRPGTKAPTASGWQTPRTRVMAASVQVLGTGILTASTPAVDLDIRDKALVRALIELIEELIGGAPIRILQATDAGEPLPKAFASSDHFDCRQCPWAGFCWR